MPRARRILRRKATSDPLDDLLGDLTGAARVIRFFEGALVHPKPPFAGRPFIPTPWQISQIIEPIFDPLDPYGYRRIRRALVMMAKKNGKTGIAAGLALYLTFGDREYSGEICSAAGDQEQASICYNLAADMCDMSPILSQRALVRRAVKRIIDERTRSVYRALSAEAGTKHGPNWHGIIFDELHTQPNRELWDTLTTGTRGRRHPLTFAISTAGYDRHSICYEQLDYARRVQSGQIEDPTYYSRIWEVPSDADWKDERLWPDANPGLGTTDEIQAGNAFLDIQGLRDEARIAAAVPGYENTFRQLSLNQWTSSNTRWLPMDLWRACSGDLEYGDLAESLKGRICYGGLDLSSTKDLTALALVFPDEDGGISVLVFFWIPEVNMRDRSKRDGVPYEVWHKQGLIEATEGNVVDYSFIRAKINDLAELYQIKEIAYDPFNATQVVGELGGDGIKMIPVRQGFLSLSPPSKELEIMVMSGKLRHGDHKVLEWCAENVMLSKDAAGNIKPDKEKSTEKIDGIAALVNAVDRKARNAVAPASSWATGDVVI